jgi:extradiol dioxygenase family protein
MVSPFHLAFPVTDLQAARHFYVDVLGARAGRHTDTWIDFDLWGHQLSAHKVAAMPVYEDRGLVDGVKVPLPHFGVVLDWRDWERLIERVRVAGQPFLLEPLVRFRGEPAEQGTFFISDPDGNALEFKALKQREKLFD